MNVFPYRTRRLVKYFAPPGTARIILFDMGGKRMLHALPELGSMLTQRSCVPKLVL